MAENYSELLQLVSARTGIVRNIQPWNGGPAEPRPPILFQARLSNFDFRVTEAEERATAGKGESEEEAITGALGEAVERYCAAHYDPANTRMATHTSLGADSISLDDFVLYSDAQYSRPGFPFKRYSPDLPIRWTAARTLLDNEPVLVPALLVSVNPAALAEGYCGMNSSGLAAGQDLDAATLSGLCESVERDAFLLTWMNRLPVPEVLCEDLPIIAQMARHYSRYGIELRIFDITSDLEIPAMMGVAIDRTGAGPAAVVGLGCHLDPMEAARKAAFEVCQVHMIEAARHGIAGVTDASRGYEQVRTLLDHSGYFTLRERLMEFDFLLNSGRSVRLRSLPNRSRHTAEQNLEYCAQRLATAGCRAAVVDLTTPEFAEFSIRAVRVLVTGLQPIHFGHGLERLGGARLYEVAHRMGYADRIRTSDDLNPCPHPLP